MVTIHRGIAARLALPKRTWYSRGVTAPRGTPTCRFDRGATGPTASASAAPRTGERRLMSLRSDIRTLHSDAPVEQVVDRLRELIRGRGLTLFAEIDHARNAREAGLDMPETRVLIFGNAKGGTALMLASPDIALELPLRILVRAEAVATGIVYIDPERLAAMFGVDSLAPSIAGLSAIAAAAAATVRA
jgi:uncharacterized protein (DUF302 family)